MYFDEFYIIYSKVNLYLKEGKLNIYYKQLNNKIRYIISEKKKINYNYDD